MDDREAVTEPVRSREDRLIAEYLRGEASALGTVDGWIDVVLHRHYRSLEQEWDDLRQEAQARIFRNLSRGSFDGRSALSTYVHRITKNVCIDFSRRAKLIARKGDQLVRMSEGSDRSRAAGLAVSIARDLLDKIVGGLSRDDRRLVYMVHVEGRSYADLARCLGISEAAVKLRMFRCRKRLLARRRRFISEEIDET